jgi:hypothetical protein
MDSNQIEIINFFDKRIEDNFCVYLLGSQIFAQTSTGIAFKGKVIDSYSRDGVSFANILVINSSLRTTTDL